LDICNGGFARRS
jgi:Protein of unknown function (DUF2795)